MDKAKPGKLNAFAVFAFCAEITLLPGRNPDPIGALWPGDDVPVTINRHQLHINGTYRIVRAAINPVGNTMDLTLNLRVPL